MLAWLFLSFTISANKSPYPYQDNSKLTAILLAVFIPYTVLLVISIILFVIYATKHPNRAIRAGMLCPCFYDCCPGVWEGSYEYYYFKQEHRDCAKYCCSTIISESIGHCCIDCCDCCENCFCYYDQFRPLVDDECAGVCLFWFSWFLMALSAIKLALLPFIFFYAVCSMRREPENEAEQKFEEKMMAKTKQLKDLGYKKDKKYRPGFEGSVSIFAPELVASLEQARAEEQRKKEEEQRGKEEERKKKEKDAEKKRKKAEKEKKKKEKRRQEQIDFWVNIPFGGSSNKDKKKDKKHGTENSQPQNTVPAQSPYNAPPPQGGGQYYQPYYAQPPPQGQHQYYQPGPYQYPQQPQYTPQQPYPPPGQSPYYPPPQQSPYSPPSEPTNQSPPP